MISVFDRTARVVFKSSIKSGGQRSNKEVMGTFSNVFKYPSPESCFLNFFNILDIAPRVEFISLINSGDQCANKEVMTAFCQEFKFVFARDR